MKRKCFTMIEVIFVVIIIGILSAVAIPKLVAGREDACYAKLRASLSETQSALSREYTKRFMQGKTMSQQELLDILKEGLVSGSSNKCGFIVNNSNNFSAIVGKDSLAMNITTDVLTKSPAITCDLKITMCQKLTGKKTTN
ncbi:prepilin-type N-terminal cleavage/methylation domain-containing protein [Helicobacter sp. MIT 14-3879]|uniref:prepilin-type N-terminal cleavage/methylation domain-containing protein n=1 Tax=Helicobacter sp. MIT 14-3879 TaxID=2040649 RepID=UPI000E1F5C3D|nr:prepilin-type N-terminal cleavage/methylation domain-containing protein [Helicobacter sp. MIT 14-3879]RDU65138.1 hypothetical protein CQA44_02155 [Helicobacter sp. MIT 14-3879]